MVIGPSSPTVCLPAPFPPGRHSELHLNNLTVAAGDAAAGEAGVMAVTSEAAAASAAHAVAHQAYMANCSSNDTAQTIFATCDDSQPPLSAVPSANASN